MEIYQGIILGILQGLTEFLPVSSSGHLALGQSFFGITEPALFFDVSLHMGTLLAVVVVFFQDIKRMLISLFELIKLIFSGKEFLETVKTDENVRLAFLIIVASIPTAFLGLGFKPYVHTLFSSVSFVGCMLLVTGTFLWMTRHVAPQGDGVMTFGMKRALLVGLCQGLAVIPGISRSGATISAGLFGGIDRETAARFSFLLSIPAIVGAEILSIKDFMQHGSSIDLGATLCGTVIAFVVGYGALIFLMRIVRKGRLHLFAPYCWALGIVAIIAGHIC
ncbi:Undecaprenyl-diphosphatase [Desulfocicer vacuolatum DSM 3385]|uniref:Undecaprenyl-diphosphatase n=1 Tax=Desulfocicer vacuolatum DSM 3385 TaxID=1121400 RepID=A0A1W1YR88_9BACT|nr:undecaprenyl-diphosphate phosphatase [Desulfocicer vacuolatum]SMC38228.1 Undecaprenyl-diphosphatase [Desulfocicer vacuolatum DSM 3385]